MGVNLIKYMMKLFFSLLFLSASILTYGQDYVKVETLSSKKYYVYLVEEGVTLESLAEDFKVSKELIIKSNPGIENNFSTGRKLMIPVQLKDIEHEVKESETLYSLCKKYVVPIDNFKSDSTIINGNIKVGQILKFVNAAEPVYYENIRKKQVSQTTTDQPVKTEENDSIIEYKVNQGETLYSISKRFMVSTEKLQKLNNITPVQLKTGMLIKIPLKREKLASEIKIKSVDSINIQKVDSTLLFPAKKKSMENSHVFAVLLR